MTCNYKLTIEKRTLTGCVVESYSIESGKGEVMPSQEEDDAIAEVITRAIEAMITKYESPPDIYSTAFAIVSRLAHSTDSPILKALAIARDRWSCVNDFDKCVSLTIDEEKLTAI